MTLYISGPMTGIRDFNRPAFHAAAETLTARGYSVWSPADLPEGWTWEEYMAVCTQAVWRCDGLAMLPGWLTSRGANIERNLALDLGKPVKALDMWSSRI